MSKLLAAVVQPVFWLALWWLVALVVLRRRPVAALRMLWGGLLALGLLGFVALPDALLRRLESTWPQPSAQVVQQQVGVIVLGGALDSASYWEAHGQVPLNDAAERMTVPLGWLHDHPQSQLVFTGASGRLVQVAATEADLARQFYTEQGVHPSRFLFESASRNTRENAQFVASAPTSVGH